MLLMLILLSDIDECSEDDPCSIFNGTCTNFLGNYICQCGIGFNQISEKNCSGEHKSSKPKQMSSNVICCLHTQILMSAE